MKKYFIIFISIISTNICCQNTELKLDQLISMAEYREVAKNTVFEYIFVYPQDTTSLLFFQVGSIDYLNLDENFSEEGYGIKKNPDMVFDKFFYSWINNNPDAILQPYFVNVLPTPDWNEVMTFVDCLFISDRDTLNVTAVREGIAKFKREDFKNSRARVKYFKDNKSKAGFDFKNIMNEEEIEILYQTFLIAEEEAKEKKLGMWKDE